MARLTKLYLLKSIFILVILTFSTAAFSTDWTRIPKTNWANSMGHGPNNTMCIEILEDNLLIIKLSIGLGTYSLNEHTPLYVEYDWGGYSSGVLGPITNMQVVPEDINGYNGYMFQHTFIIDLDPLCTGENPPTSDDPVPFDYSFNLVTPNHLGGYDLYPVLSEPEVFPVYMFPELSEPNYTPEYGGSKQLCCMILREGFYSNSNDILDNQKNTSITEGEESNSTLGEASIKTNTVSTSQGEFAKIFPNPVVQQLNIDVYSKTDDRIQIDLIDISGAVIKTVSKGYDYSGIHRQTMNLNDLSQGIYFCRIRSDHQSKVIKVIKL